MAIISGNLKARQDQAPPGQFGEPSEASGDIPPGVATDSGNLKARQDQAPPGQFGEPTEASSDIPPGVATDSSNLKARQDQIEPALPNLVLVPWEDLAALPSSLGSAAAAITPANSGDGVHCIAMGISVGVVVSLAVLIAISAFLFKTMAKGRKLDEDEPLVPHLRSTRTSRMMNRTFIDAYGSDRKDMKTGAYHDDE